MELLAVDRSTLSTPAIFEEASVRGDPRRDFLRRLPRTRRGRACCAFCLTFVALLAAVVAVVLSWQVARRPQCNQELVPGHLAPACAAINVLQDRWYEPWAGGWQGTEFWGSANSLQATIDFMNVSGSRDFADLVAHVHALRPRVVILVASDGSYDDALWWSNAYLSAFEVLGGQDYLESARGIFDEVYKRAWETESCAGGMWWSSARSYKNAITNELALLVASRLHLLTREDRYLRIAQSVWDWFRDSGLINQTQLVNDGLSQLIWSKSCRNNGGPTWTYNQGVIIGGLVNLHLATHETALLEQAVRTANATLQQLVDQDDILHEALLANSDGVQFKGIFVRNLRLLMDAVRGTPVWSLYADFLRKNVATLLQRDKTQEGTFGGDWSCSSAVPSAPPTV